VAWLWPMKLLVRPSKPSRWSERRTLCNIGGLRVGARWRLRQSRCHTFAYCTAGSDGSEPGELGSGRVAFGGKPGQRALRAHFDDRGLRFSMPRPWRPKVTWGITPAQGIASDEPCRPRAAANPNERPPGRAAYLYMDPPGAAMAGLPVGCLLHRQFCLHQTVGSVDPARRLAAVGPGADGGQPGIRLFVVAWL